MVYIYALKLEQNKYYIGKTNIPHFRIENHFSSNGSEWTKMYKPLSILEIKPNCDDYDEDKITRQYMDKYGIDNVRGGSFVSIMLNKPTIDILQQMSNGTNNKCFTCGGNWHFSKDCIKQITPIRDANNHILPKKQLNNKLGDDMDKYIFDYYDSDEYEEIEYKPVSKTVYVQQPPKTVYVQQPPKIVYVQQPPKTVYVQQTQKPVYTRHPKNTSCGKTKCFRCGRTGHYSPTCYATTNIHGKYL
uniref:CCHC-type domain-containing protein n=1 Tax=viral metagenome TaxID=1070528 RepID=A0A6C0B756_9ZZZZ